MFMGFSYQVLIILVLGPSTMKKHIAMGMQMCVFLNMETVFTLGLLFLNAKP